MSAAVRTHEPLEAVSSGSTTTMTAFIIDDDGFWVPSPAYDASQPAPIEDTDVPPPPAPMPFSSLWPFFLQEILCKGTPPFTLTDRDPAYTHWYASQPGKRKEILEDELSVGYELCEERMANGKARKRVRYEAFWDEAGRRSAGPSPLRNVVHTDKSRRTTRRARTSSQPYHHPVSRPTALLSLNESAVAQSAPAPIMPSAIALLEEIVAAQRFRRDGVENREKVLSSGTPKRRVRRLTIGNSAPLVPVNGVRQVESTCCI